MIAASSGPMAWIGQAHGTGGRAANVKSRPHDALAHDQLDGRERGLCGLRDGTPVARCRIVSEVVEGQGSGARPARPTLIRPTMPAASWGAQK
jgi:hypothetical protein